MHGLHEISVVEGKPWKQIATYLWIFKYFFNHLFFVFTLNLIFVLDFFKFKVTISGISNRMWNCKSFYDSYGRWWIVLDSVLPDFLRVNCAFRIRIRRTGFAYRCLVYLKRFAAQFKNLRSPGEWHADRVLNYGKCHRAKFLLAFIPGRMEEFWVIAEWKINAEVFIDIQDGVPRTSFQFRKYTKRKGRESHNKMKEHSFEPVKWKSLFKNPGGFAGAGSSDCLDGGGRSGWLKIFP